MIIRICKHCGKEYKTYPCHEKHTKYCSRKCMYESKKGKEIVWLKEIRKKGVCLNTGKTHFKKGKHYSKKNEFKKGHIPWSKGRFEELSSTWVGDKISRDGVHDWVERIKGKPNKCEICGTVDKKRKYEWSNKKHDYKRVLSDYVRMCKSCHIKYDYRNNNYPIFGKTLKERIREGTSRIAL